MLIAVYRINSDIFLYIFDIYFLGVCDIVALGKRMFLLFFYFLSEHMFSFLLFKMIENLAFYC